MKKPRNSVWRNGAFRKWTKKIDFKGNYTKEIGWLLKVRFDYYYFYVNNNIIIVKTKNVKTIKKKLNYV